jgi:hypothetical protein
MVPDCQVTLLSSVNPTGRSTHGGHNAIPLGARALQVAHELKPCCLSMTFREAAVQTARQITFCFLVLCRTTARTFLRVEFGQDLPQLSFSLRV